MTGTAVVVGASVAGLLAARVLADTYASVVVLDRDQMPMADEPRRGVPQGAHVHALQPRGQQILSDLFPGITQDMVLAGARYGDTAADAHWFVDGEPLPRTRSGLVTVLSSRPFLERHLRARVGSLPHVRLVTECDVTGLVAVAGRVAGVRVSQREAGSAEVIDADLVVDAAGRGSRLPVWLTELGCRRVPEERLRISLGYVTRRYRIRSGARYDGKMIMVLASPGQPRGAICGMVEADVFMVTLSGMIGDHPPTDPEGFAAFAKSLPTPSVFEIIQDANPLDEPVAHRFPASLRRRYDLIDNLPANVLPIGDGVCSLNPTYAQGMSVAALGAVVLGRHLAAGGPDPRRFVHDLVRDAIGPSWHAMKLRDLGFLGGRHSPRQHLELVHWRRVQQAAVRDPWVASAFLRVIALVDPLATLLRPRMFARTLRYSHRR